MTIEELTERVRARWEPPPDLRPSEWANRHRRLSPEASAEPGEFDMNRTPYMREILDAIKDPDVEEVWFTKSSQVTASENLNNLIGYLIDCDPCPIMLMQPTLEMAEDYSKDRIEPMLRDSPRLASKCEWKAKSSGNTIRHKSFPGGLLQMVGANSAASLASRPIRVLLSDEVDRYPGSAKSTKGKSEGDPIRLGRRRQETFFNRFFLGTGTPTVKGASRIEKGVELGDVREYRVPCPRCGEHFAIELDHFEKEDPEAEHFGEVRCPACSGWIAEHERFEMIRDEEAGGTAHWAPTRAPTRPGIRSYRLWSIYSPFKSWREIAEEWVEAKGDPEAEQVVTNTLFGRSYEFRTVELDHEHLFKLREDYDGQRLPAEVLAITAGVDTQDDRFEVEVVAWGPGEESWSVEYATIDGDPDQAETREALDRYLADAVFATVDGRELVISAAFVDSGGHRTDAVYKFARGKGFRHVYASKGSSVAGQPIFARFTQQKKERCKLAIVGTDTAKEVIFARLARGAETRGRCHFPLSYSLEYFAGLTSEEKKVTWTRGGPVVRFVKRTGEGKSRNEPLDCRVYALAALRSLPMIVRTLRRRERAALEEARQPEPREKAEAAGRISDPEPEPPAKPDKAKRAPVRPAARRARKRGGWKI